MVTPLRYGIVGTGMMGCEHIYNIEAIEHAHVVAISDPHPASLEWARTALGQRADQVTVHHSLTDMVNDPSVDALVIATPNFQHIDALRVALASDKHIMIEKPLCTTVHDCLEVRELAEQRDALTWVALEYRFMPGPAVVLDQVRSGAVGAIKMVAIREHRFPFLPKVQDWNRLSRNTGGTLVEKCCHFFDLMRQIAGADPVRVFASGGQDVNHLDEVINGEPSDLLDNAFVIVDFANGVRANLDLSMFAEGGRFEQELTVVGDHAKLEATVPGDTVWLGERHQPGQVALDASLDSEVTYEGFHHGSSQREHLRFIECIASGRPPLVTVTDGLFATAMGQAAHESIALGHPIEIRI